MDSQRCCRRGQRLCCKRLADERTLLHVFGTQTEWFVLLLFRRSLRRRKFRQQRICDTVAVEEYHRYAQWGDKCHSFVRRINIPRDLLLGCTCILGDSNDASTGKRRARKWKYGHDRGANRRTTKTAKGGAGLVHLLLLIFPLLVAWMGDAHPVVSPFSSFHTPSGSESEVYDWDELPNPTIDTEPALQQLRRLTHRACGRVSPGKSKVCRSCPNLARSCGGASRPCSTWQSSTWTGKAGGRSYIARSSEAVDGNANQNWCGRSMTHTKVKGTSASRRGGRSIFRLNPT